MNPTNSSHGDFGRGDVRRLILSQAIPLTLASLVQLLYNIVDRIYIGHMPGEDSQISLTGIGLCFPLITLIASFVNLISTGAAPLCSMARGRGDKKEAEEYLHTAFTAMIVVSVTVSVILFATKRPLLYLLGASDVTYAHARSYLNIYLLGTLFFAIGTGMNTFINLQGYPRMGMFTTMIGAVINLVLDPIFIFWLKLGVRGAAIATVISEFCAAVWVLAFLTKKNLELRINLRLYRVRWPMLKKILTVGFPGFIVGATNCLVQAVCNATLSQYGGDLYIGIMTIINSVREVIGLPIHGITNGSQPILSFNYGAGSYDRVKRGIRFTAVVGLLYTAVFWLSTMLIPRIYLRMFTNDGEILKHGRVPLIIYFMGFIFMAMQFSGQSTFVALGKAKQAVFFSIFRKIIIVLPLTMVLPMVGGLGVYGVFLAEPVSNLIGGAASFFCMYLTVYRRLGKERYES